MNEEQNINSKDEQENSNSRIAVALGYLIFFIPLVWAPNSNFAKFHANQAIVILLFFISFFVFGSILPFIGWIFVFFGFSVSAILSLIGAFNALKGKTKKLPIIGSIQILKQN